MGVIGKGLEAIASKASEVLTPRVHRFVASRCPSVDDASYEHECDKLREAGERIGRDERDKIDLFYSQLRHGIVLLANVWMNRNRYSVEEIQAMNDALMQVHEPGSRKILLALNFDESMRSEDHSTSKRALHIPRQVTGMERVLRRYSPRRYAELVGMMKGAGRENEMGMALLCQQFEISQPGLNCSTIAVRPEASATGHAMLARNFDLWSWLEQYVSYRQRAPEDGLATKSNMIAGLPGAVFVSNGRLALGLNNRIPGKNDVQEYKDTFVGKVPASCFVMDMAERYERVDDVLRAAEKYPIGGAFLITMIDAGGTMGVIEVCGKGKTTYKPEGPYFHVTNHSLCNPSEVTLDGFVGLIGSFARASCENRYLRIQQMLDDAYQKQGNIDIFYIFKILSDTELLPKYQVENPRGLVDKIRSKTLPTLIPVGNSHFFNATICSNVAVLDGNGSGRYFECMGKPSPEKYVEK